MNKSPLNQVIENSSNIETNLSSEAKSDWSLFKKAINGVCMVSVLATFALGAFNSSIDNPNGETSNFFGNQASVYNKVLKDFSFYDVPLAAPINYVFDEMQLDPEKTIIQSFEYGVDENTGVIINAHATSYGDECVIYMPEAISQSEEFLLSGQFNYKNDFVYSEKMDTYLNTSILFHEAIHCLYEDPSPQSGFLQSLKDLVTGNQYEDTKEEITADTVALQHMKNIINEDDISYSEFVKTITSARMMQELNLLISVLNSDFSLTNLARDHLASGINFGALETSNIEVTVLDDLDQAGNTKNFFGVNSGTGNILSEEFYEHFISQSLISSGLSFHGYELTIDEHVDAFKEIANKLGNSYGSAMYFSNQGEFNHISMEKLLVSLVALSADTSISNEARQLISNYLSVTEIIDFNFDHGIEISKRGALGDKTIIQLKEGNRYSTFHEAYPSLIVIEKDGSLSNVSTHFDGKVYNLSDYSFDNSLDFLSTIENSYTFLNGIDTNSHDIEAEIDDAFYEKFPNG